MTFTDMNYWVWYRVLDNTIYASGTKPGFIGSKEHSFFMVFFLHAINANSILSFVFAEYLKQHSNIYISLGAMLLVFLLGYIIYFKNHRAKKVIAANMSTYKIILSVFLTVLYVAVTLYVMWNIGNYIRNMLIL